jgi:ERO1-like protein beta
MARPHPSLRIQLQMFARYAFLFLCMTIKSNASLQINPKAIVSDACASYSTLDKLNSDLKPALNAITQTTDFFAYYRLNLFNKECPFWSDSNGMCGNIACAVNTLDNEEDIPPIWRAKELGKLEGPKAGHPGKRLQEERGPQKPLQGMLGDDVGESCVVEYDDECDERDYCVPEDESATAKGDYVSLVDNLERFTGYSGEGAKQVWDAIYRENCFSRASFPASASLGKPQSQTFGLAANDLKAVMRERARLEALEEHQRNTPNSPFPETVFEDEDECLEKRVFYRVISGMHASISTHLCYDYLNQQTGAWGPNLTCYIDRLHTHPERISNLYFNYALILRAVAKLGPYLRTYTFCSGDPSQDANTKEKVQDLTFQAAAAPQIFDESLMFVNGEGPSLKEDFRNRFRNVSRLMDCVGCDKCRLWGKLQTAGYGAALKVLFEFDNAKNGVEVPQLKRTELVALFNTLARISNSLSAIESFRDMVEEMENKSGGRKGEHFHKLTDRERLPHRVVKEEAGKQSKEELRKVANEGIDEDFDEFIAENFREREAIHQHGDGLWEIFEAEFGLVWKTFKFVIRSWINFPGTV